jgi:anti-anti-sigma regulatory factor
MPPTFDIDVSTDDGIVVARLAGELDLMASGRVTETVTSALASTDAAR